MRGLLVAALLSAGCPELTFPPDPAEDPTPDAGPPRPPSDVVTTRKNPECWRRDDPRPGGYPNTCRFCHTTRFPGSALDDGDRQTRYPDEDNPFPNVTAGERELDEQIAPTTSELIAAIARDNFLAATRRRGGGDGTRVGAVGRPGFGGGTEGMRYFPDLDFGDAALSLIDPDGFVVEPAPDQTVEASPIVPAALDADHCLEAGIDPCTLHRLSPSGWRAVDALPFSHPFAWPRVGGAFHLAFVRLPEAYRSRDGVRSRSTYAANLDTLVRAVRGDPSVPATYAGDAARVRVLPFRHPIGTELLLVRFYIDPSACDQPSSACRATRVREVRYAVKSYPADDAEAFVTGGHRRDSFTAREGEAARELGLIENGAGWDLAAFIEASDEPDAPLRPQTPAELEPCKGCHGATIGAAVDSFYVLSRALPGAARWRPRSYATIDPLNLVTGRREIADAARAAFDESAALAPDGTLDPAVFFGPPDRLATLGKRQRQIVRAQDFTHGRDPILDEAAYHELVGPSWHPFQVYAPVFDFGVEP